MTEPAKIMVWASRAQEELLREVLADESISLLAVGSDESATAADLAATHHAERLEDLRQALHREDADLLWLAGPVDLEPATLKLIGQKSLQIVSSYPQPGSISDLISQPDDVAAIGVLPLMQRSAGFRAAEEIFESFGRAECINVSFRSDPSTGSLFSRLYDAMDVVTRRCGEADTIDAALVSPTGDTPENLGDLTGHMTVNLRFPENRSASITISDRAGRWFRGITVLGPGGCLRIDEGQFEWIGLDGATIDSHTETEAPLSVGGIIAAQLRRIVERRDSTEPPADHAKLMAACEAARVSSRTGEWESPRSVMRMFSRL